MNREFIEAIEQLEIERNLQKDVLIEAIEAALVSAYKKNYGTTQNVEVNINRVTGDINVIMRKEVVDEVFDDLCEISLSEAKEIDEDYALGDQVIFQVTPHDFGRIAAQTAKQVVVQRIRDAEKIKIYTEYTEKNGELITGTVSRVSGGTVFVDIGQAEGIIPSSEIIPGEEYYPGQKIRTYLVDVKRSGKGPQIYLSRSHPSLVRRMFELEVPEIADETVKIMSVARDAGSRTKIAVLSMDENVDAVGACVGQSGIRVRAITDELNGEKIDIVNWNEEPAQLIKNALSPALVEEVILYLEEKSAIVIVPDQQLSLAIGKRGQNAKLAAKLTGWKVDIKSRTDYENMELNEEEFLEEDEIVEYSEE